MRTASGILGVGLTVVLAGCGMHERQCPAQGPSSPPSAAYARAATPPGQSWCPLAQLQGVDAIVADMSDGVAVTFRAPAAEVAQLRQNVRVMAAANDTAGDAFVACACANGNGMGVTEAMPANGGGATERSIPGAGASPSPMPRSMVADTETPTGAVLELRPSDPAQLLALRTAVKEHIHALRRGCLGGKNEESR
ncbi:MAG TPA: hypothetical protein VGL81_30925 [Polyangiaceae bacterium]|jgi:hypothetical protein